MKITLYPVLQKNKKRYKFLESLVQSSKPILLKIMDRILYTTHIVSGVNNNIGKIAHSRFVPSSISEDIDKHFRTFNLYTFSYNSNTVNLTIHYSQAPDCMRAYLLVVKMFTLMELVNSRNISIDLVFIPTTKKKLFKPGATYIGNTVNSGMTYFLGGVSTRIVIYREEECMKVALHELCHFLHLDFGHERVHLKNAVSDIFSIQNDPDNINIFEGYTETIALLYNSIFNSILTKKNIHDILSAEIKYSIDVASNILHSFNMEHILKSNNNNNKLHQKSNVVSYYFIKLGCISSIDDFLRLFPLGTIWTPTRIQRFVDFSVQNLSNIQFTPGDNIQKSIRMTKYSLHIAHT